MLKQSIIIVSVGKDYYHQLTRNLINSFLIHDTSEIKINVLTDRTTFFKEFITNHQVVLQNIDVNKEDKSFTAKFYMYDKAIAEENIFIDCDCLIYQDLSDVFKIFKDKNFSAIGSMQQEGDFFCDISKIISKFNIESLPVFVGSIYYFKKNDIAKSVFEKAIELKKQYDELGFIRLRNKENEEPLIATAMALHGEKCVSTSQIKADAMFYEQIKSNVVRGTNKVIISQDKQSKAKHLYSNTTGKNIPIIHFNDTFSDSWIYKLESFRLSNHATYGVFTNLLGNLAFRVPSQIKDILKNSFRPLFRKIVGTRKIKQSNRI